jgi:uncharacterized protein YndB with AHSA1/START domain
MTNLSIHKNYRVSLPTERLYEAWISPKTVIPPVSRIEVEPKVDGFLRLLVEMPQGTSVMNGRFLSLAYPTQLVYTWEWDNNGEVTTITVDFKAVTDGTEITITHVGFQSEASRATHDTGWDSYVAGVVALLQGTDPNS